MVPFVLAGLAKIIDERTGDYALTEIPPRVHKWLHGMTE
jgi:hypothetical protein